VTDLSPARLRQVFAPRTFAVVGAGEKSTFARLLYANLVDAGLAERVHLVNPKSPEVFGRATHPSCTAIGEPIDLAFVMVPVDASLDVIRDAAAAGAQSVLVLSSGFAEAGVQGRRRQSALLDLADQLDVVVLGPNVLGYLDVGRGVPAMALADPPRAPGNVALISQSGASCGAMKDFAALADVGLSHVFTVGNEAMLTVSHLVDYLVEEETVDAIAVFMEAVRDPEVFTRAARRAAAAGKALVVLKAGRSALSARAAASHTGALVGDDRVIDAVFRRLGVIRVDTIEDMLVTAGFAAHTGPLERPGLGVVSISGGACDIVADLAAHAGVQLPELSPSTAEDVAAVMPQYGHVHNPLDITGAAIADPAIWQRAVAAVGSDPAVGAVFAVNSLPWREDGGPFYGRKFVDAIGAGMAESKAPACYLTQVTQPVGAEARGVLSAAGVEHVVPGLRLGVDAFARVASWSALRAQAGFDPAPAVTTRRVDPVPLSEVQARALLRSAGVPVVPARHVHSGREAERACAELGHRVAMKIVSPDITHKTDVGGVRLGVPTAEAAEAYDGIIAACQAAGFARLDGVLVSPMRDPAPELLVGVTRDPDWGPMLAVALGGVLVEVLDDVVLSPLPVSPERAREMLHELRGAPLLRGTRGRPPVDIDRVAATVSRVGRLAEELGEALESLEVNPLRAAGGDVEALDAVVLWRQKPGRVQEERLSW
jgi:acyl-CoA synthetase (NDP forming)